MEFVLCWLSSAHPGRSLTTSSHKLHRPSHLPTDTHEEKKARRRPSTAYSGLPIDNCP